MTEQLSAYYQDDCPHCQSGIIRIDEYDEPEYCSHCERGLKLELARLESIADDARAAWKATESTEIACHYFASQLRLCETLHRSIERRLDHMEAQDPRIFNRRQPDGSAVEE